MRRRVTPFAPTSAVVLLSPGVSGGETALVSHRERRRWTISGARGGQPSTVRALDRSWAENPTAAVAFLAAPASLRLGVDQRDGDVTSSPCVKRSGRAEGQSPRWPRR